MIKICDSVVYWLGILDFSDHGLLVEFEIVYLGFYLFSIPLVI